MSVFSMAGSNPALPTYPLQRSVRLRSSATAYFNRTLTTPTSNTTWTYSLWVKRGALATNQALISAGTSEIGYSVTTDTIKFYSSGPTLVATSTPVYRDPSAWGHLVFVSNGTTVVAYYNNVSILSYTGTLPQLNSAIAHNIGKYAGGSSDYFDGYLTEVNFIDGQALTPSSFGAYNSYGVWSPAKYTGTYGTNGFYLNFQDNSALTTTANIGIGKDSSGNGNYWTSNNISITAGATYDSMLDVPTNTSPTNANFAVGNPLNADGSTWSGGNLNFSLPNSTNNAQGTVSVTSGKWYWEMVYSAQANGTGVQEIGLRTRWTSGVVYAPDGTKYVNGTNSAYGAAYAVGDIIGVALDMDGGTVTFYKNNTSQGSISLSGSGCVNATFTTSAGGGSTSTGSVNFGQRPFTYTPPTGYNRLCTYNLPDSIVPVGAQYMAATLYTGTGAAQSITNTVNGTSLQPDFVWTKCRSFAFNNNLTDSVRGITKKLVSNTTDAETTITTFSSFNTNGFTFSSTNVERQNDSGQTYVAWQWRASNASAVTNTSGSITSQVSANQTAGFSIVTYTGTGANATVGHGLGVAPRMIIVKWRTGGTTESWAVYHASLGATNYLSLNTTNASAAGVSLWNNTSPTSTVVTIGTDTWVNASTRTYVAYCFAAVPGYSAFGSYTGNGSADGPFVYTGFRPRFILLKLTSSAGGGWYIYDTSRNTYNVMNLYLRPDASDAETTFTTLDSLSNGFKVRTTSTQFNGSGSTYIYAAFSENPFKNSLAR